MFTSIFGIMFATMAAGFNQPYAGDIGQAKNAAKNIFEILDAPDEFQIEENSKRPHLKNPLKGDIEFRNIKFKYESRDKLLFENLNLMIFSGKKVSLVGPSGCGKSTILQMLLRFYDPLDGQILIDGIDIQNYDLRFLRR